MKANKKISLEQIGKELPFNVPQNYFEQFAVQLETQIGHNVTVSQRFIKPWMYAVAAIFIGVMVLTPVFYNSASQRNIAKNTDNYESYVLSQVDEAVMYDCYVDNSSKK